MYRSRCCCDSHSKNFCAVCNVRPCTSPQKVSFTSARKCWKCSVIGVTFAIGCKPPFLRIWFSLASKNQLTPSYFLHKGIYVTPIGGEFATPPDLPSVLPWGARARAGKKEFARAANGPGGGGAGNRAFGKFF